jgi:hypothetical protein
LDAGIALGTVGAVIVALFGQAFRAKFFPPKLALSLADALGEGTRVRITPPAESTEQPREEEARYYHLRVKNSRRWSPATEARVVLLQVEEPGPDGRLQVRWNGDIPLGWRHNSIFPPFRVVGPDAFADLCSVVRGKWIELHTLVSPFNLETRRRQAATLVVSVQVHATETNSNTLRLRISWDGGFAGGAQEMRRHLTVEEVD